MENNLVELRGGIDDCDMTWVLALSARFVLTKKVGELKAYTDLPAIDPVREQEQFERIGTLATKHGVPIEVAQGVLRLIIDSVVQQHEAIKNEHCAVCD